jgi:hypothetical protein
MSKSKRKIDDRLHIDPTMRCTTHRSDYALCLYYSRTPDRVCVGPLFIGTTISPLPHILRGVAQYWRYKAFLGIAVRYHGPALSYGLCVSTLDSSTTLSTLPHTQRGVVDCHLTFFSAHDMFAWPHPVSPWCSRPQDRGKIFTTRNALDP